MTKLGAGKKVIIVLLSIMMSVLTVFSVLGVVGAKKINDGSKQVEAVDYSSLKESEVYAFERGPIEYGNDEYYECWENDIKYYSISTFHGLINFSDSVRDLTDNFNLTFADCTIFLKNDIYNGDPNVIWKPIGSKHSGMFKGTFDGNGKTITGLKIKDEVKFGDDGAIGFFARIDLTAIVKNLKIDTFTIEINNGSWWRWLYIGGIAGVVTNLYKQSEYGIFNCSVENFKVITNSKSPVAYVGGIVGYSYEETNYHYLMKGYIKNCYVSNAEFSSTEESVYHMMVGPVGMYYADSYAKNPILNYDDIVCKNIVSKTHSISRFYFTGNKAEEANKINTIYSDKTSARAGVSGNSAWYIPEDDSVNDGWPCLKLFFRMGYTFKVQNVNMGKVQVDSSTYDVYEVDISPEMVKNITLSQTLNIDQYAIFAKPEPGYKFLKWTQNEVNDREFIAYFTAEEYTLSFNAVFLDGLYIPVEGDISSLKVKYKEILNVEITEIDDSTKTFSIMYNGQLAYKNIPWEYDIQNIGYLGQQELEEGDNVVSRLGNDGAVIDTVPQLKYREFNITYKLNGGVNSPNNPETYNCTQEFVFENPTQTGYEFQYWLSSDGYVYDKLLLWTTGDLELEAIWEKNVCNITYVLNGGLNHPDNPTQVAPGELFTINAPTRDLYNFLGWSSSDGENDLFSKMNTRIYGDVTYTAYWEARDYIIITYDLAGGQLQQWENNPTRLYDSSGTVTLSNPVRDGYVFDGWSCEQFEFQDPFKIDISYSLKKDLNFVANWSNGKTYTYQIWLSLGNDEWDSEGQYTMSDTINLRAPAREGYDFVLWQAFSMDGTAFSVNIKEPYNANTYVYQSYGNIVLYALYEVQKYDVQFNVLETNTRNNAHMTIYKNNELLGTKFTTYTAYKVMYGTNITVRYDETKGCYTINFRAYGGDTYIVEIYSTEKIYNSKRYYQNFVGNTTQTEFGSSVTIRNKSKITFEFTLKQYGIEFN